MIKGVSHGKEISVAVANKVGILAEISRIVADHGINIEGIAGYVEKDQANLMMVTDDNLRASDALKKAGYESVKENDVVMVDLENRPGSLKNLSTKLAGENIDILYSYATACGECPIARVILSTSDNEKTLLVLKK